MAIGSFDKKRIRWFLGVILLWQAAILGRVLHLKVILSDDLHRKAQDQNEDVIEVPAARGKILDCHLEQLAVSVPMEYVGVSSAKVKNKDKAAQALARVLDLDPSAVLDQLKTNKAFHIIKRFISPEEAQQIRDLKMEGVGIHQVPRRNYPNKNLAAHILGLVNLKTDNTLKMECEFGVEGLERFYNEVLSGEPNRLLLRKDGHENWITSQELTPAKPGHNLILNIDCRVQSIAERELDAALKENGASRGMVLIMEPNSGRILAMVSRPNFDPNNRKNISRQNLRNGSVEHYFEPGSTFKVVTAAAALEEKLTYPSEVIYCGNGSIFVNGRMIHDHRPFQDLTFTQIMTQSSDVGAIKLGLRLGVENFYRYIRCFGFGERTGIDLPVEQPGLLRSPKDWSGPSIGAISMGQEIGVTGVQILRAMAVIANGGYLVRPYLVDRILDENGLLIQKFQPQRRSIISERTAAVIRDTLTQTVESGTGQKANVDGYQVAGKTGTAQKFDFVNRCYSKDAFIASFAGFAPVENPSFVIVVVIDAPHGLYHGGDVAAPVFASIAKQILVMAGVQPSQPIARPEVASTPVVDPKPAKPTLPAFKHPPTDMLLVSEVPGETVIPLVPDGSFIMPDFTGKSLRSVMDECARLNLGLQPSGSGVAIEQDPPAGARVKRDTQCNVWFSDDYEKIFHLIRLDSVSSQDLGKLTRTRRD